MCCQLCRRARALAQDQAASPWPPCKGSIMHIDFITFCVASKAIATVLVSVCRAGHGVRALPPFPSCVSTVVQNVTKSFWVVSGLHGDTARACHRGRADCNVFVWCPLTSGCDAGGGGNASAPFLSCQLKRQAGISAQPGAQPAAWQRGPPASFVSGAAPMATSGFKLPVLRAHWLRRTLRPPFVSGVA